jgi:sugar/nucleoside kinase (ribokinase family)
VEPGEGGARDPPAWARRRWWSRRASTGCCSFGHESCFAAPALPLETVIDPTGAGDTFAGGFIGYLASVRETNDSTLRQAVVMGSTLASFCVEAFSLDRLLTLTRMQIGSATPSSRR